MYYIKWCSDCNRCMKYAENKMNGYTYLICPVCRTIDNSEKHITVEERIKQGYFEYNPDETVIHPYSKENIIDNNEF